MNKKRVLSFIFAICFALCLSVPAAMADPTATAGASAGAIAGSTAIGSGGIASTGPVSLGVKTEINSTGSKISPQTPVISPPSMIQNFGPVVDPWNISPRSVIMLCVDHPEWTRDEAEALINEKCDSSSQAVFCRKSSAKTKIFFDIAINGKQIEGLEKPPADKVFVGVISVHGDEDANSFDAFGRAVIDCTEMGGTILVISKIGGQPKVVGGGWHIGGGGVQTSVSGADGGLGSAVSGIAGGGKASSMYVGLPYIEGLAYRDKVDGTAAAEAAEPAIVKSQKKAPMGMHYDEYGNIQFGAYGAGIIKNGQ